jgi:type I restriction enzyme S subunit
MMEATYPAHESYKPSGYDWVGEVPAHWAVEKLGTSLRAVSEKNRPDLPLLSITREQGVIERDLDDEESNHNFIPDDLSGYKVLRAGQFGMNKMKAWQGSYGVSQHTGIVSPAYFIFDFTKEIDPDFFNRAIRSKLYVSFFGSASDGVRIGQWDLNKSRMREIPLLVPPLPEQRAIAAFLDDKCAKIDGAVKIKEGQIALLRERRQIIIQNAITRGLNPAAPMKDSGIDWIGQIPAHWEVVRLRHLTMKIGSGVTPTGGALTYVDNGVPLLRSQNILFGKIDFETAVRIDNQVHERMSNSQVMKGDVLLNITGGSIGRCHYVESSEALNVNQHVCIIRPNSEIISKFLNMLLASEVGQKQVWLGQQGGGREGLNFETLKGFIFPLPSLTEQLEISEEIEIKSNEYQAAISIKQDQIGALKEYKTSLINAAVTGKIKVI